MTTALATPTASRTPAGRGTGATCLGVCENPGAAGDLLSIAEDFPDFWRTLSNLAVAWTGHELIALSAELNNSLYPDSSMCLQRYADGLMIAESCHPVNGLMRVVELVWSGSDYLVTSTNQWRDDFTTQVF